MVHTGGWLGPGVQASLGNRGTPFQKKKSQCQEHRCGQVVWPPYSEKQRTLLQAEDSTSLGPTGGVRH